MLMVCVAVVIVSLLAGCQMPAPTGENDNENGNVNDNNNGSVAESIVARTVFETEVPEAPYLVILPGDFVATIVEPADGPRSVVITSADGEVLTIVAGAEDVLDAAISSDRVFLFSNYTDTSVDVTVVQPDGTRDTFTDLAFPDNIGSLAGKASLSAQTGQAGTLSSASRTASRGLCAIGLLTAETGAGAFMAILTCSTVVMDATTPVRPEDATSEVDGAPLVLALPDAMNCVGTGNVGSCVSTVATVVSVGADASIDRSTQVRDASRICGLPGEECCTGNLICETGLSGGCTNDGDCDGCGADGRCITGLCATSDPDCAQQVMTPVGACCLPENDCSPIDQTTCVEFGGQFQGEDVSCADVVCDAGAVSPCAPILGAWTWPNGEQTLFASDETVQIEGHPLHSTGTWTCSTSVSPPQVSVSWNESGAADRIRLNEENQVLRVVTNFAFVYCISRDGGKDASFAAPTEGLCPASVEIVSGDSTVAWVRAKFEPPTDDSRYSASCIYQPEDDDSRSFSLNFSFTPSGHSANSGGRCEDGRDEGDVVVESGVYHSTVRTVSVSFVASGSINIVDRGDILRSVLESAVAAGVGGPCLVCE